MVETIQAVLFGAMILSSSLLLLGLLRPVYVLWFLDRFNRLKVLQVYGTSSGLCALGYFLLDLLT